MAARKYLFWKNVHGIQTYKVLANGTWELKKPWGKTHFPGNYSAEFWEWFQRSTAITADEVIDFCFLSDEDLELPALKYAAASKTSWDKQQIAAFCSQYMRFSGSYEICYAPDKSFVCQTGPVLHGDDLKKLYVRCVPTLEPTEEEVAPVEATEDEGEASVLYKFMFEQWDKMKPQ